MESNDQSSMRLFSIGVPLMATLKETGSVLARW